MQQIWDTKLQIFRGIEGIRGDAFPLFIASVRYRRYYLSLKNNFFIDTSTRQLINIFSLRLLNLFIRIFFCDH